MLSVIRPTLSLSDGRPVLDRSYQGGGMDRCFDVCVMAWLHIIDGLLMARLVFRTAVAVLRKAVGSHVHDREVYDAGWRSSFRRESLPSWLRAVVAGMLNFMSCLPRRGVPVFRCGAS